jgi:hypothetical protein
MDRPINGTPRLLTPLPFVKATAVVDLLSKFERPFRFQVTVFGYPPHAERRVYEIIARTDKDAAMEGINRFTKAMQLRGVN